MNTQQTQSVVPAVFQYHKSKVRVFKNGGDAPWWVAKDICEILSITTDQVRRLDDDERGLRLIQTPGGNQEMVVVNESGLYSLVLGSRKPEAKAFRRWITHEVLPSIRKTGGYTMRQPLPDISYETKKWALSQTIPFTAYNVYKAVGAATINEQGIVRETLSRLLIKGQLNKEGTHKYIAATKALPTPPSPSSGLEVYKPKPPRPVPHPAWESDFQSGCIQGARSVMKILSLLEPSISEHIETFLVKLFKGRMVDFNSTEISMLTQVKKETIEAIETQMKEHQIWTLKTLSWRQDN